MNSAAVLLLAVISTCAVHCKEDDHLEINVQKPATTPEPLTPSRMPEARNSTLTCRHERQNVTFKHDLCEGNATTKLWGCYGLQESYEFVYVKNSGVHLVKMNRRCVPVESIVRKRKLTYSSCKGKDEEITIKHSYAKILSCAVVENVVITPVTTPTPPPPPPPTDC